MDKDVRTPRFTLSSYHLQELFYGNTFFSQWSEDDPKFLRKTPMMYLVYWPYWVLVHSLSLILVLTENSRHRRHWATSEIPSATNETADPSLLGLAFWEGDRHCVWKPIHRKRSEPSVLRRKGKWWTRERTSLVRCSWFPGIIPSWCQPLRMACSPCFPFLNWSFHQTDWFKLFTWIITVDSLPSELLHCFQPFVNLYMICWSFLPQPTCNYCLS